MGNFNKRSVGGGRFDNRGGGGGRGSYGGGRDRGRPEMHPAICSDCGKHCEVPFKPTGDKPVLCSDCFKGGGRDSGGRDRGGRDRGGRDRGRSDFGEKRMHKAVCAECGNRCEVPFKPTGDKPVLCSSCFGGGGGGKSDASKPYQPSQSSEKHDEILSKLDKILTILQRTNPVKEITVMKPKKGKKTTESDVETPLSGASQEEEVVKKPKPKPKKKAAPKKKTVKKAAPKKTAKKTVKPKAKKTKK